MIERVRQCTIIIAYSVAIIALVVTMVIIVLSQKLDAYNMFVIVVFSLSLILSVCALVPEIKDALDLRKKRINPK